MSNEMHPWKTDFPIDFTVVGINTVLNELQFLNASSPINVIEDGIVISFSDEQFWKTPFPSSILLFSNKRWKISSFPVSDAITNAVLL